MVNTWQTLITACYFDYDYLEVMNPNQLTVEGSFFLETHANFTSSWGNESKRGQTLIGVTMHGNMYVSRARTLRSVARARWPHPRARLSAKAGGVQATGGGPSIVVAPEFTDGSNCDIAEAVREPHSMTPAQLKLTRARKTVRAVRFFAPLA